MTERELHVVTGSHGYTGRYLTRRLLAAGIDVRSLTGHPDRPDLFEGRVSLHAYDFDDPDALTRTLEGARVLYNTYWVRFDHGSTTYESAVENTRVLFDCARRAGVERIVHVSITNPTSDSPLPYFAGKAALERSLGESGVSHAIIRPTVLFGKEDILVNNIAYLLRRLPLFGVPGSGDYGIQPVYVDDLAALMAEQASLRKDVTIDAVGPERMTYMEMVRIVRDAISVRAGIVSVPGWMVLWAGRILGRLVGDVVITPDEVRGLSAGLLVSADPPTCPTSFAGWVREHRATLGQKWASELSRHY